MIIFGVRDRKARRYINIFTDYTKESRTRSFITVCNDPKTSLGLYPTDYELYALGEIDEISGNITANIEYIETGHKGE